ncbi:MAG TPA: DUF1361 domain-containing protein, partial [Ferruginibacter sp.]|nr:DUF1361 domain-containing protein [Ferruginibacter sp.]
MAFRFQNLLFSFFALIAAMIICRAWYSGELLFIFLVWNIFLAWLPFAISGLFSKGPGKNWKDGVVFLLWLAFFPNSLYIITDLIHLQLETDVPKWF